LFPSQRKVRGDRQNDGQKNDKYADFFHLFLLLRILVDEENKGSDKEPSS
jgi:hypothetical protein